MKTTQLNSQQAYRLWSAQYDSDLNKTRDLEAIALRTTLADIVFKDCLEIGCGTGKNTAWLLTKAKQLTAVDFSPEMLAKAKEKIISEKVCFIHADITNNWNFTTHQYQLISFSLVLEHIEDLNLVFREAAKATAASGYWYIGELHPFKQYTGTKARFDTADGQKEVACFTHHISAFTQLAKLHSFSIEKIDEYFDNGDKTSIPRILTLLLKKN